MKTVYLIASIISLFIIVNIQQSCTNVNSTIVENLLQQKQQFSDTLYSIWHQGKAEITSYALEQARYGEMHNGEAVLIFVTEDFSKSKNVKLDRPTLANDDAVNVLKMNMTKKFLTGIYPYSMMLSVFTPFNTDKIANTFKVTATSQEWCGHTFSQLNLKDGKYSSILHSYFENEADQKMTLPVVLLEDELWTLIRIAPDKIPVGEMQLLPGSLSHRLRHTEIKPEKAIVSISSPGNEITSQLGSSKKIQMLSVDYSNLDRTLIIYFTEIIPYQIIGWEETCMDGFGENKKTLTTKAVRKETLFIDYWNHNKTSDESLRDSLSLSNCL